MNEVFQFFSKLFDTRDWPPRWHCGNWTNFHGWLYIIAYLAIWSAYFAIPLIIVRYLVRQKRALRFNRLYFLFAAFILACGVTHFLDALMFWYPYYRISALARLITGILSWLTVVQLFRLLPTAFSLKTSEELEQEVRLRKLAEEALQKQNKFLNESQKMAKVGSWEWDVKSNQIVWSDEQYRIWGLDIGMEVTNQKINDSIHPADKIFYKDQIIKVLESKEFVPFTHRILRSDGDIRHILARGEVELNEQQEVIRITGTSHDVTQLKEDEVQLFAKTLQLERRAGELEQFAYVASHDLQEPLRKISSFTSMLKSGLNGNTAVEQQEILINKIISATGRMQQLINDILDFSRVANEHIKFQTVNLNAIVRFVMADMEMNIESSQAKIKVGSLPELEGIPAQLQQVFQNLISNAIKFRKEGIASEIEIRSVSVKGNSLNKEEQNWLRQYTPSMSSSEFEELEFARIEVQDNGIGFDAQYAEKIFQIFQRLHGRSEYEGTGIGLAICKRIVDNHHGLITAQSESGKGALFTIILPISQGVFVSG